MTAARDPWWSSGVGPDEQPHGEHDDPVAAHRAARRGRTGPAAEDGRAGEGVPASEDPPHGDDPAHGAPSEHGDGSAHAADICGVCPICLGARLLGETRPELLAHLTEAARHLAAAARTLLDEDRGEQPSQPDADAPVTRIDLD